MRMHFTPIALLAAGWLCMPSAHAAPPPGAQREIGLLLGYVEGSGCEFYRNGSWNSARAAQDHLRDKYRYLAARDQIDSAEQFIDRAATHSSLSGRAYMVRCQGAAPLRTQQWLRDELARLRDLK